MKNLSLGLNIILLLAVGFLFVQHFSAGKSEDAGATTSTSNVGKVAYIDIDTLYAYYDYYRDIRSQIQDKGRQASVDLQGRAGKFAKKRDNYIKMAQAGVLSNNQIKEREEALLKEGQDVERYQASVQQGLAALEQEKTQELYETITEFLDKYNEEKGYEYILGYQTGNIVIMHTDKKNDITMEVVNALNEEYKASSETATTEEEKK